MWSCKHDPTTLRVYSLTIQVYCGDCARARALKHGNKKEKNAAPRDGCAPFKKCAIDNCGSKVDTKGAMIQVYL